MIESTSPTQKFGPEQYPAGTIIFRQGDPPEKFYIITTGQVNVWQRSADGVERLVNQLHPGDFFGEIGMVQWQPRLADVQAITDVSVMSMDRSTFLAWLNSSELVQAEIAELIQQRTSSDAGEPKEQVLHETAVSHSADLEETAVASLLPASFTAVSNSGPRHFQPGETIVRQGDLADTFYIIVSGTVAVLSVEDDGREHFLNALSDGDYFGEIGLMAGGRRIATVRAITSVHAMAFDREAFRRWIAKSPDIHNDLLHTAVDRLGEKMMGE